MPLLTCATESNFQYLLVYQTGIDQYFQPFSKVQNHILLEKKICVINLPFLYGFAFITGIQNSLSSMSSSSKRRVISFSQDTKKKQKCSKFVSLLFHLYFKFIFLERNSFVIVRFISSSFFKGDCHFFVKLFLIEHQAAVLMQLD